MTTAEFGQWFFALMIALALAALVVSTAWEWWQGRRYRDNQEIKRRMLGLKRQRGGRQ